VLNAANTVVADNTAPGDPDLNGLLTSQGHNLIGNPAGGSGFVLSDLANVNPLLGPLQDNGGPTQTMALLPGSPALDAGNSRINTSATDQRGLPRVVGATIDIGAFESRGFTLAAAGGDNQSAAISTSFGQSLVVSVTSAYGEPVQGGVVTFTAPATGPTATFSAGSTAVLDATGHASVSVQANATAGPYLVTATAAGAGSVAFHLSNQVPAVPTFSALAAPTIVYGTPTTTLGGTLTAGASIPSGGVVITLNGVSQTAALDPASGHFTAPFDTHLLGVARSPYAISYAYTGDGVHFTSASAQASLTVLALSVTGVLLDDGTGQAAGQVTATGQHSLERRLVLTLSGPLPGLSDGQTSTFADAGNVTVGGLVLSLERQDGLTFGVVVTYSAPGGIAPTLVLTFTGGTGASQVVGGSLADGNYRLTANGQVVASFYRLFGDSNGDRRVDAADRTAFLKAYRSRKGMANYACYFDYNADGTIDGTDYYEFLRRYQTQLNADGTTTPLP
jgi:hypothetical protein